MIKKFLKSGGQNFTGQLIMMLIGLLFAGLTVRYLGAGRAGFFIIVSSILGWVQLAGGSSFYSPVVQKLANLFSLGDKTESRDIIRTTSLVNILIGLPFAIGSIAAFPILFEWSALDISYKNDAFLVIVFSAIGFLIDQWGSGLYALFEAHQKFGLLNKSKVFISIFGNSLRLAMLIIFTNMASLAIIGAIVSILSLIINLYFTKKLIGGGVLPWWKRGVIKPMLNFGLLTWLSNTSNVLFFNLTGLVIAKFLGSASLIYVAFPQKIILSAGQVIIGGVSFLFPAFSSYGDNTEEVIKSTEDRLRWLIGILSFSIFVSLALIGPLLLTILVGAEFSAKASLPLYLFCIYGIVWAQETVYIFANSAVAKVHGNTVVGIVTAVLTLILTWLLVPKFGYLALPIAQLVKLPAVIWLTIWSRKILKLPSSLWSAFSTYLSLTIGALLWILVTYVLKNILNTPNYFDILYIGVGFFFFALVVFFIEFRFFGKYGRLKLIFKILSTISNKVLKKDLKIIKKLSLKYGG